MTTEEKTDPKDKIVRIGIKPVEKEVETDYKTRIEYDANLEAGKVGKTEGKKGKTKITTTFNQETNKLETTEEVLEESKDEVIKIGTKAAENTTEVSKEVGTKIEYIYDDDLELGNVILGDFTPGKVVTKVVQKYDPATGEITTEEKTTVTPGVQKIVVGTKKTDNTCPMPDPDPSNPTDPS
ncbi:G5 domain-containing protein, partial [Peptoniphilus sp. HMSC062D09]|uniref:G5 domain-containing protein n=1 Tax=Peptoniphilus sp. HMSC062D09 TaxID=1739305 RepID=UPI001AF020C5